MPYLNICGWEAADNTEANSTSGTFSVQGTTVRTGARALQVNPTTTGAGYYMIRGINTSVGVQAINWAVNTLWFRVYFRYGTKPSANSEPILGLLDSTAALKFEMRIDSSGNLSAYNASNTLVATGATVLSQDTWYLIEFTVGTGASASYEIKIDGTSEISGTSNFSTNQHGQMRIGKHANRNGNTVNFYYDDVAVHDTSFPGAGQLVRMQVTGNGAYTAWTNDYLNVDEIPHDGDTSIINTSTSGNAETVTFESCASAGISGTINAVQPYIVCRDEGGTSAFRLRLRVNGTDNDTSTNRDHGSTYQAIQNVHTVNPTSGLPWTTSDLDSAEVGVRANAAVAHRCTMITLMVDFTPAAAVASNSNLTLLGVG